MISTALVVEIWKGIYLGSANNVRLTSSILRIHGIWALNVIFSLMSALVALLAKDRVAQLSFTASDSTWGDGTFHFSRFGGLRRWRLMLQCIPPLIRIVLVLSASGSMSRLLCERCPPVDELDLCLGYIGLFLARKFLFHSRQKLRTLDSVAASGVRIHILGCINGILASWERRSFLVSQVTIFAPIGTILTV